MRVLLIVAAILLPAVAAAGQTFLTPFESAGPPISHGRIDDLVFAQWRRSGVQPANPSSDEVFLRRVYLDVIGTLPSGEDTRQFLADSDPHKRAALIDRLLARDEFADYWTMKWCDLLRVKSEFPINLWPDAVQAYYRWIHTSIRDDVPYDVFVRALLTASGSNFRVPETNFYRAVQSRDPRALAQSVALTWMGVRAQAWPDQRLKEMSLFFSRVGYKTTAEWKEEIVYFDFSKPSPPIPVRFPDGKPAHLAPDRDPRAAFADWLLSPVNPWFARNVVNRIWSWLEGRGIVEAPDDFRADNPPSNPELLAYLERELIASHYNLKHIYRLILNSQVYQMSSIPVPVPASQAAQAAMQFASYPVRRLDAEVLVDAIDQVTGATEEYLSLIPEPFTFLPEEQRAISLPDGSIGSAFLEMFGRPPRDSGLESERNNQPTAEQRLHLLNSSHIQLKIQQSTKLRLLVQSQPGDKPRDPIDRIYLALLSRYPTDQEIKTVSGYFQTVTGNKWPAAVDLAWALINSAEFLCRH